jgi:hypothetical protein
MAYEIHLSKYSEDLQTELPIQSEEWEYCANTLGFRYIENDCIGAHSFYLQGWFPIFGIRKDGSGYMKTMLLLENNFTKKLLK